MLRLQPGKKSPVQSPHGGLTQGGTFFRLSRRIDMQAGALTWGPGL